VLFLNLDLVRDRAQAAPDQPLAPPDGPDSLRPAAA
jgi:hypothetical protein